MEGVVWELATSDLDRVLYRQGYIQALSDISSIDFDKEETQ